MSSEQTLTNGNERRNLELENDIIVEQDKRSRQYIIWSNIVYAIVVFVAIAYIVLLVKDRKTAPANYLYKYRNEIYFLVLIIIYTVITMVNSLYYHDCGGSLNSKNVVCPLFEGKGYDFRIVAKNDYLFSGLTILMMTMLFVRKFNGRTFKFFITLIANIYMIAILSFTKFDNAFAYANLIFVVMVIVCVYLMFRELFKSTDDRKTHRIVIIVIFLAVTAAAFGVYATKKFNAKVLDIADNATIGDLTPEQIEVLKENIRKDNVLHGTWHIMGAVSAFLVVLYKIFDIKQFTNSK
jgi:hypothetical protein